MIFSEIIKICMVSHRIVHCFEDIFKYKDLQCSPTERVIMEDGGVGDVGQLGEVPDNIVECVARRPHLHQVQSLLGGQVRPLPKQVIELSSNIRKVA